MTITYQTCGMWNLQHSYRRRLHVGKKKSNEKNLCSLIKNRTFKYRCCYSSVDLSAPSIMPPQVRVPSTPSTLFSIYIVQIVYLSFELECEKNKNKQKEAGIVPFKKRKLTHLEAGWKGWVRVFRGKACPVERRSLRWDWRGRTRRPVRHRRTPSSRENAVIVSLCESPGS